MKNRNSNGRDKSGGGFIAPLWAGSQVPALLSWESREKPAGPVVAVESLSLEAELSLRDARRSFQTTVSGWDHEQTFGRLEETVEEWLERWFGSVPPSLAGRLNDLLGFDFRRAIYADLKFLLLENLRIFVTFEKILRVNPSLLIFDEGSPQARVLAWLAGRKRLPATRIKVNPPGGGLRGMVGKLRGKLRLGRRGRMVRAVAGNLLSARGSVGPKSSAGSDNILLYGVERFPTLLRELTRTLGSRLIIYNLGPGSREAARSYSLRIVGEFDSYTLPLLFSFLRRRREIKRLVGVFFEAIPPEIRWGDYDLRGLFSSAIRREVEKFMGEAYKYSICFPGLFENCRIRKLIIWIDHRCREKSAILSAGKRGITTVNIPHGAPANPIAYLPVDTDRVATWGRGHSGWYRKHGVAEKKLIELGNPEFDKFYGRDREANRAALCEELRLNPALFLSVVAFSGYAVKNLNISYRDLPDLGLEFLKATSSLGEHFTFWKVHGAGYEDPELYKKFAGTDKKRFIIGRYRDNPVLLSGCDAFFTHDSTIGLEAMLAGTPVFILNFRKRKMALPYAEYMPGCEIVDPGELPGLIDRLRRDGGLREEIIEKQNAFLGEYLSGQTPNSSRRIARWIVSV